MPDGFSRTAHAAWHGAMNRLARWTCDLSVALAHEAQRSFRIAFRGDPVGTRRSRLMPLVALVALAVGAVALAVSGLIHAFTAVVAVVVASIEAALWSDKRRR